MIALGGLSFTLLIVAVWVAIAFLMALVGRVVYVRLFGREEKPPSYLTTHRPGLYEKRVVDQRRRLRS